MTKEHTSNKWEIHTFPELHWSSRSEVFRVSGVSSDLSSSHEARCQFSMCVMTGSITTTNREKEDNILEGEWLWTWWLRRKMPLSIYALWVWNRIFCPFREESERSGQGQVRVASPVSVREVELLWVNLMTSASQPLPLFIHFDSKRDADMTWFKSDFFSVSWPHRLKS